MINSLPVTINGYTFTKVIGRGGFSTVYLVYSTKFKAQFCAKVLNLLEEDGESQTVILENEIKALMALNHPHIIRLYDSFLAGKQFVIVLEFCPGGSLQDLISKEKALKLPQFINYAKQIIQALEFCHSNSIAHHDIKLANVLLDQYGRIKLADFGISFSSDSKALTNSFSGSMMYEPPEIILKKPHNAFQADIWSLGVLFAYMINGVSPWRCDNVGLLKSRICSASFRLRSSTPPEVAELIHRMLIVNPEERITMKDLLRYPIFQSTPPPLPNRSPSPISDVLSPRARTMRNQSPVKSPVPIMLPLGESKAVTLYKMNIAVGGAFPRIRPRFHSSASTISDQVPTIPPIRESSDI